MRTRIFPFELRAQAPDDEMLEIARAADANLFMDATDLPTQATPVATRWPGKQDWALENLLIDIGATRRLAWEIRESDRALLVGAEPDIKALRQKLLQGVGIEIVIPKLDEATFNARLFDFLLPRQKQLALANGSSIVPVSSLPAELQTEVLARIQRQALASWRAEAASARELIGDTAWQQARLFIASQKEVGGPDEALLVSVKTSTGGYTQVLTALPQPRAEGGGR